MLYILWRDQQCFILGMKKESVKGMKETLNILYSPLYALLATTEGLFVPLKTVWSLIKSWDSLRSSIMLDWSWLILCPFLMTFSVYHTLFDEAWSTALQWKRLWVQYDCSATHCSGRSLDRPFSFSFSPLAYCTTSPCSKFSNCLRRFWRLISPLNIVLVVPHAKIENVRVIDNELVKIRHHQLELYDMSSNC